MSKAFKEMLDQIATGPKVHTSQLYIFSRLDKKDLQVFQQNWPNIPTQRRQEVMQELVEICEANFEVSFDPVFFLGMGDEDAQVRASAINGLWENETIALIKPLIHLLRSDPASQVRATAASALGKFVYLHELEELDQPQGLLVEEALLATIHQPLEDDEVRRRAIEAISYSSEANIIDIIENAYYDDNEKMQVSAIFAMGRNADARWRPRVLAELDNPIVEIRFEAVRACGELELKEAMPRLVSLVEEEPDPEVQQMAIWAMGRIGGPLARDVLEQYLDSDIEAVALAAEEALDELNLFDGSFDLFDFSEDDSDDLYNLDDFNGYSDRDNYLN